MTDALFDRLGGRDGLHTLCKQIVANHFRNPVVASRYEHSSMSEPELVTGAHEFFCTGLSGVETYEGRPLPEVHAGMNISEAEFVAVLDDVIGAMQTQGYGELEQSEVLGILWGMKSEIVHL